MELRRVQIFILHLSLQLRISFETVFKSILSCKSKAWDGLFVLKWRSKVSSRDSHCKVVSLYNLQSGLFQDKNLEYEKLQLKVQHGFQIVSAV